MHCKTYQARHNSQSCLSEARWTLEISTWQGVGVGSRSCNVSQVIRCHAKLMPNKAKARRFAPHEMHLHMVLLLECLLEH